MVVQDLSNLKVGDRVMVDCIDGFGGPAHVVETREVPGMRCKVAMDDRNPQSPFWAHDFEVTPLIDSRLDTYKHIQTVQRFMGNVIGRLLRRQQVHDQSKLVSPEVEVFDEYTGRLATSTYGSDEYKSFLAAMKPALDHHYATNSHHPEHYTGSRCAQCGNPEDEPCSCGGPRVSTAGIHGMSLLDLTEMLCDWKAATLRHNDGDIRRSIEINQKRFGYSDELKQILFNTLAEIEEGS
jgi:hypothetical protein